MCQQASHSHRDMVVNAEGKASYSRVVLSGIFGQILPTTVLAPVLEVFTSLTKKTLPVRQYKSVWSYLPSFSKTTPTKCHSASLRSHLEESNRTPRTESRRTPEKRNSKLQPWVHFLTPCPPPRLRLTITANSSCFEDERGIVNAYLPYNLPVSTAVEPGTVRQSPLGSAK
jgi:hypothetical protein